MPLCFASAWLRTSTPGTNSATSLQSTGECTVLIAHIALSNFCTDKLILNKWIAICCGGYGRYSLIIPTILRIYSNYQSNPLVTRTIEFTIQQFYIMHRKPFMLQLFGSISPLLDTDENSVFGDANKVLNDSLFSSSDYANDWLERERCQNA
jgi:hypothetical protein